MWRLATPKVSGLFNVGKGKARSFRMIVSASAALGTRRNPISIARKDSRAATSNFRKAGRTGGAEGYRWLHGAGRTAVALYVTNHLAHATALFR